MRSPPSRIGRLVAFGLAVIIVVSAGPSAQAGITTATLSFDKGNDKIANNAHVSSPYATLQLTADSTAGTVQFALAPTSQSVSVTFSEFGFNTSLPRKDITSITGLPSGWTVAINPSGGLDGFGKYDFVVSAPSSSQGDRVSSLSFTANVSPASAATVSNFEESNGKAYFAMDYFPSKGKTGFVAVTSLPPAVPEPTTMAMALTALPILGVVRRLRRSRATA
jgi:hypothetical protein